MSKYKVTFPIHPCAQVIAVVNATSNETAIETASDLMTELDMSFSYYEEPFAERLPE